MSFLTPFLDAGGGSALAQIGGAGMQAAGAYAAGQQAATVDRFNANVARGNATQEQLAAQTNAAIEGQNITARMGEATAAYGAAGVDMTGSPLAVMADLAAKGELQKRLTLYNGAMKARADTIAAQEADAEAKAAGSAGTIKGLGTLLTGATQFWKTAPGMPG
jgi:hypothetical protein